MAAEGRDEEISLNCVAFTHLTLQVGQLATNLVGQCSDPLRLEGVFIPDLEHSLRSKLDLRVEQLLSV